MLNLREMAQTDSNIRKLDETKKLPKQPYCVGCENKIDDWDVYVDMREESASTHATCPHCGLINYEDSKDIDGFTHVLVFFIGIPIAVMYGASHLEKEFSIAIDEDYRWMLWVAAYGISLLLYCLVMDFRVSDLEKRMKEIEERS
jgi:uncharacterized Zn-finger protein